MAASGLGSFVAAAAPGAMQGIGQAVGSYQDYQKDKALDASVGQQTGTGPIGTADANHPVWGILNNLTGNPGNAPLPGGAGPSPIPSGQQMQPMDSSQFPAAQMGAAIPTNNAGMVNGPISMAAQNQMTAPQQLQNGGVVRANYGRRTIAPSFERGPVLPTGPNNTVTGPTSPTMQGMAGYEKGGLVSDTAMGQGITPASTEGQMLMFDAGGVVPDGFHEQQGISGVPMTGRGASLVEGIQAGQNIGHNLQQAWHDNRARSAAANYAGSVAGVDVNNPNSGSPPASEDWLGKAKDAVESFFHHMNNVSLDDNHKPNGTQAIPAPGAAPTGGVSAPGGSPVPSNGPSPGAGAPPSGGAAPAASAPATPSPIPNPAGAAPGAAPPQPGAGPSQPPGAQPGGAAPVVGGQAPPQQPNVQQQATQVATKSVAANPEVQQGIPDKTPAQSELPHSMTPDQWQHMNLLKQKAVMAAARAGEDPAKVYESLTAMQNAHFQGQILKQLGTANVAFQNGDMKAVEQALKNVNYYLPNGQDIQFRKATAQDATTDPTVKPGDLMYKNPFYGMYGHEHDPEYTKIDSQHIQSLGAAALNPQTVQEAQLKSYSVQQEAQSNRIKAQGEFMTGQGRQLTGAASYGKMGLAQQSQDVDRRLKIAAGNKDQAEANWYNTRQPGGSTGQPKITMASLRSLQNDAASYTDRIVQGQPTTSPVMVKDETGQMTPNLSPGAGRAIPDASRIPAWATNGVDKTGKPVPLTPEQQENVKVLGGQINSANAGLPGMNTPKAVELAARITHYQSHPTTHTDPATGKPAKDFVYDRDNGTAHVWVGNAYENVYLKPNVADESGAGGGPEAPPPGGNSAPGSGGGENEGPDAFQ